MGRRHEKDHNGNGGCVFQNDIEMIEQLFLGHGIAPDYREEQMSRTIDLNSQFRRKEIDQQIIHDEKDQGEDQHKAYFPQTNPGKAEKKERKQAQKEEKGRIETEHGRQHPKNQEREFGSPAQAMNWRLFFDVVKEVDHGSHLSWTAAHAGLVQNP